MGFLSRSGRASAYSYAEKPFKSLESFQQDGIEVARRRRKSRFVFPTKQVLLFALAFLSYRIFLFFEIGANAYSEKLTEWASGGPAQKTLSFLMTLDPISMWIINGIRFGTW